MAAAFERVSGANVRRTLSRESSGSLSIVLFESKSADEQAAERHPLAEGHVMGGDTQVVVSRNRLLPVGTALLIIIALSLGAWYIAGAGYTATWVWMHRGAYASGLWPPPPIWEDLSPF